MTACLDQDLQAAMHAMRLPGIAIGHRVISPGDESTLMPEETAKFARSVTQVRRASGAARLVARRLLADVGFPGRAIPNAGSGEPIWPVSVVGSISHDSRVAVAAVALRSHIRALGIDVEPAENLPPDLLDVVATPQERADISSDPYRGRLLFAAKEAVYKAVYPLDRVFLDHHDVSINLMQGQAIVRNGRILELCFCAAGHIVVVAFQRAVADAMA